MQPNDGLGPGLQRMMWRGMSALALALATLGLVITLLGTSGASAQQGRTSTDVKDTAGRVVGRVTLTERSGGVQVSGSFQPWRLESTPFRSRPLGSARRRSRQARTDAACQIYGSLQTAQER